MYDDIEVRTATNNYINYQINSEVVWSIKRQKISKILISVSRSQK